MSLGAFSIDELTFDRLVTEAMRRIPERSGGDWTLHAPVDPGITFIELFAWLLEQRSYFLDQVPAPFVRALLRLLGDRMLPARSAGVPLLFGGDGATGEVEVPRRSVIELDRAGKRIAFTTRESIVALPVKGVSVTTWEGDRTQDLAGHRAVPLFPAHGGAAQAVIRLHAAAPFPAQAVGRVSLLVEVEAPAEVEPEWSPDAAAVPPPAVLRWRYRNAAGELVPLARLSDGTGGLRRAGIVRFALPADWDAEHEIVVDTQAATFTSAPLVAAITANAALAQHRKWVTGVGEPDRWLPLPGRVIDLRDDEPPPLEERIFLSIRERDGVWRRWRPVADFTRHGPAARVFVVDRAARALRFGDGLNGRVPHRADDQAPTIRLAYEAGAGDSGNVGASADWDWVGHQVETRSVVQALGGTESEDADAARDRAAATLRRRTRAVTVDDHETIARETPGVAIARAHAAPGHDPAFPCSAMPGVTTVFVVPAVPRRSIADVEAGRAVRAPTADPGALAAVRARFDETRLAGGMVHVAPAAYRRVAARVTIEGDPWSVDAVRTRVASAVRRLLDPLVGGEDGEGWPFGAAVDPTGILRAAQEALDDDGQVAAVAIGLDGAPPANQCGALAIGPHDLVEAAEVDVVVVAEGSA